MFGLLAFLLLLVSTQCKTKGKLCLAQEGNAIADILACLLLHGWSGLIINTISGIRNLIVLLDYDLKRFVGVCLRAYVVVGIFIYQDSIIAWLAVLASCILTLGFTSESVITVK